MITVENIKKSYQGRYVLDIPALQFEEGGFYVVVGHNGSGKTTLLRLINRLEQPDSGVVNHSYKQADMVMCFQKPYLFSGTVRENIQFGLKARKVTVCDQAVNSMIVRLGLEVIADKNAKYLSSGECQRVSLARALVLLPKLLLLDEPFANVDPQNVGRLEKAIRDMNRKGTTIIMVSHIVDEAYHFSSNVIRLEGGRVVSPEVANVFECIIRQDSGLAQATLSTGLRMVLTTKRAGQARIAISPKDIILSEARLKSSMQNTLSGSIVALRSINGKIEVSIDAGQIFKVYITQKSVDEMGLTVGKQIYLSFKATAVKVF